MNKFIKITLHDNDFTSELRNAIDILCDFYDGENIIPNEDDFETISNFVQRFLLNMECVKYKKWYDKNLEEYEDEMKYCSDYFIPDISIAEESEVEDWNNHEDVYWPLFGDEEPFVR